MTNKELVLIDISARLHYGLYIKIEGYGIHKLTGIDGTNISTDRGINYPLYLVKPYLRSLSSMTEEEKLVLELCNAFVESRSIELKIDFYNQYHIDYRGLIEKDLAIEAPEGMYNKKNNNYNDNYVPNNSQITVGTKIRLKTNKDIILSIISNDCHDDEFECSNGSVLSLKQIEKYYDIII